MTDISDIGINVQVEPRYADARDAERDDEKPESARAHRFSTRPEWLQIARRRLTRFFFVGCDRIDVDFRLSGAVGTKSHILRSASNDEQRRQHQQSHRQDAEYHPGLPPADGYQQPSR